jgi:hypothetical protein
MAFRSARLKAILGASPETATYDQLAGLVGNEAAGEAEELDYKLRYDTGERAATMLPLISRLSPIIGVVSLLLAWPRSTPGLPRLSASSLPMSLNAGFGRA